MLSSICTSVASRRTGAGQFAAENHRRNQIDRQAPLGGLGRKVGRRIVFEQGGAGHDQVDPPHAPDDFRDQAGGLLGIAKVRFKEFDDTIFSAQLLGQALGIIAGGAIVDGEVETRRQMRGDCRADPARAAGDEAYGFFELVGQKALLPCWLEHGHHTHDASEPGGSRIRPVACPPVKSVSIVPSSRRSDCRLPQWACNG